MAKVSKYIGRNIFLEMWIGDNNENDLDHLPLPSGRGHHYIKIFPGSTNRIDLEIEGSMPQYPITVSFLGGGYTWTGRINSVCNGCPGKTSCEVTVTGRGQDKGVRLKCSSLNFKNSWGNRWQQIDASKTPECIFDVK